MTKHRDHSTALALALVGLAAMGAATAAHATAYVDVRALWSASLDYYEIGSTISGFSPDLPSGVSVSCFGGSASVDGCFDRVLLDTSNSSGTPQTYSLSSATDVRITNSSSLTYTLVFRTDFSAFNPGGPSIGAWVDDPALELASFASFVRGFSVGDAHSCTTTPTIAACGVSSPDSSQGLFGFTLAPGQSYDADYLIAITATLLGFDPVPEPSGLLVLGPALFGLFLWCRPRAHGRKGGMAA